ncbi:SDR family NAD(P)-dependent oxidoreductase [Nocardia sp. NPDC059091]|uniref:SDR family NAD(P)-dependent oxidoreductase n=1 Tax=unclassified Nocardia TaxID=2637762 RepID=UPI0036AE9565
MTGVSDSNLVDALRASMKQVERLRRENRNLLAKSTPEPLAIVGMGCRYPGGVTSAHGLWEMVASASDVIGDLPRERGWDLDALYDPQPGVPGKSYTRSGGFLYGAGEFDADFFGISPREALGMDPQQRQLLEVSWEALEDAGIAPETLHGSRTGVYIGVASLARYGATGNGIPATAPSVASGRVSYALGLEGPAVTVDTACSSSLVALHLAGQAIRSGECELALVGGATVLATPELFVEFSRQQGLSADGRCRSFAGGADGTGWAEGVGVLVVEPLSRAKELGHRVLAVVAGSAVNQDGASNGLTAPNGPSQQRVIRQALANAGLGIGDVDVVEAHGTGTKLGDPIEAQALLATYGQRDGGDPLWLGSIKSNMGHSQAAAGVAGVIKMVQAMRFERMPATLHVDVPSPHVDWSAGRVELLTEAREWPRNGRPRRAAVSSFGISGTNAHIILEEPSQDTETIVAQQGPALPATVLPWVLSAKTAASLTAQAARLREFVRGAPVSAADVSVSLARRSVFPHRAVVLGSDLDELLTGLDAVATTSPADVTGSTALVFPGQGSQWIGMGRELLRSSAVFADHLRAVDEALSGLVEWSLLDVISGSAPEVDPERVDVVQPLLFAVMTSLARWWESIGVRPDVVIGHSQGEIAAAYVAGGLSLHDAVRVVVGRARAIVAITGSGGMVSVAASAERARELLDGWGSGLSIAAVNGPAATVISGDADACAEFVAACEHEGVWARRIPVDYASHSEQVERVRDSVLAGLSGISPRSIPDDGPVFVSTVTGRPMDTAELTAEYWYTNLRATVEFERAVVSAFELGCRTFVESSPHPVLTSSTHDITDMLSETTGDSTESGSGRTREPVAVVGSLHRDEGDERRLLAAAAEVFAAGGAVDWPALAAAAGGQVISLPAYAFQHRHFWQSVAPADAAGFGLHDADHPLLGVEVEPAEAGELVLTGRLSLSTMPWLADHAVFGQALFPGTGFLELALHAADRLECDLVRELTLRSPLIIPSEGAIQLQVIVGPDTDSSAERGRRVAIYSRPDDESGTDWTLHAEAAVERTGDEPSGAAQPQLPAWPPTGAITSDIDGVYQDLLTRGYEYGPVFQGLTGVWRVADEVFAEAALPGTEDSEFALHPALLDAVLHALAVTADPDRVVLPFAWSGVRLHAVGATRVRARMRPTGADTVAIEVFDAAGQSVLTVETLLTRPISADQLTSAVALGRNDGLHRVRWNPLEIGTPADGGTLRSITLADIGDGDDPWSALSGEVPDVVVLRCSAASVAADPVAGVHVALPQVLRILQSWLGDERFASTRLVVLTGAAVDTGDTAVADLTGAAIWGLVASAQSENPGRITLLDSDADIDDADLERLLGRVAPGESQLVQRGGELRGPRLVPVERGPAEPGFEDPAPFAEGAVLITGGTGGLGALLARHLVRAHGVRDLMLSSRRGAESPEVDSVVADLRAAGARVRVRACDVTDPNAVRELVSELTTDGRLTGVVHAAGVLDDGVLPSLSTERLRSVLLPKADGGWNLHEATAGLDLPLFAVFSSIAGVLGTAGQGNYAAGNRFLDGLISYRRSRGLSGVSLAWGLWDRSTAMTGHLDSGAVARMSRDGLAAMTTAQGLALWDAALASGRALLVPAHIDRAVLRSHADDHRLRPLFSALVREGRRRAAGVPGASAVGLRDQLTGMAAEQRFAVVLDLIRTQAAAVLGHETAAAIDPDRAFKDLGFDSLSALQFRNALSAATGLRLRSSLIFDYPAATALARHLLRECGENEPTPTASTTAVAGIDEPLVIVGMACRYPGGVDSPAGLWSMVDGGLDVVGDFPLDRGWDVAGLYDPRPGRAGKCYTRSGGFLSAAGDFDPGFFGISPKEALAMDPQQRLLLEASWEALEDAGIDPHGLKGSATGVYAGLMYHDYPDSDGVGAIASGRISYVLGLEGPAVTVDTACSSSLVALHLAGQAVRSGECELALVGGVTVMATPEVFVEFSRQQGLSADGRCRSFAGGADGTGWAEGVGVLVVEQLSRAQELGHRVLAVVAGSAVNQDGASNGLTAPNGPSQQRVIHQALANAGLGIGDVDVVEAHGTATKLGDPIEAQALLATYGQRDGGDPLWLGSIKSNMGHAQAAAGVAGVIKMVQAMRFGRMPATLHVDVPSPHVDWSAGRVELLTQAREWPRNGRPRRAAVSSFGISGTNAHIILEEPPVPTEPPATDSPAPVGAAIQRALPFVLSGKSAAAVAGNATRLRECIVAETVSARDAAVSLLARSVFDHRAVVVAADAAELLAGLEAPTVSGRARVTGTRTALVFPGQGSQWIGMGRELAESSPVFAEHLHAVDRVLSELVDWSLLEVISGAAADVDIERVDVVQPVLFAVMTSLAKLWESIGVHADVVVGHSQGEIAAAYVAGALSLPDAVQVVVGRGRAIAVIAGSGSMVSVAAPVERVRDLIADWGSALSVAAVNSPTATVVSGDAQACAELIAACEREGVWARRIPVDYASHSEHVNRLRDPVLAALTGITPRTVPVGGPVFVSTVTGQVMDTAALTPEYWFTNLRETVRLDLALATAFEAGCRAFVESSPHPVLTNAVHDNLEALAHPGTPQADDTVVVGSLRRDDGGWHRMLTSAAELFVAGGTIDWPTVVADHGGSRVSLPPYAFQHERYWQLPQSDTDAAGLGLRAMPHVLLGAVVDVPDSGRMMVSGRLSAATMPWLADHAVFGRTLFPGTGFVELVTAVADRIGCAVVQELTIVAPLLLPDNAVQVCVILDPPGADGTRTVSVHSRIQGEADEDVEPGNWTLHAEGVLGAAEAEFGSEAAELPVGPPPGAVPVDLSEAYELLSARGYDYGPAFRGLTAVWRTEDEIFVEAELPGGDGSGFGTHPALLDAVLHAVLVTSAADSEVLLPFSWSGVRSLAVGATRVRARLRAIGAASFSIEIADTGGRPVMTVESLLSRPVSPAQLAAGLTTTPIDGLHLVHWNDIDTAVEIRAVGEISMVEIHSADEFFDVPAREADAVANAGSPTEFYALRCGGTSAENGGETSADVAAATHALTARVLEFLRNWLGDPRFAHARLVVVTRGAIDTAECRVTDPAAAAVWGLVASAQSEYPDRIILLDSDIHADETDIGWALSRVADTDPQLALRGDTILLPRLVTADPGQLADRAQDIVLDTGTVLVSGGTAGLGAVVARHLVDAYGARDLVLSSRRGSATPEVDALVAELRAKGARVRVASCDVADRESVRELVSGIVSAGRLVGVVHAAGVLDDGVFEALTDDRLATVLAPKVDGGWNLHESTAELELSLFAVFSSIAGVLGTAGQANYAAGNRFLDGLISYRRARGLAGVSLAWGLWGQSTGLTGRLNSRDVARMHRDGLAAMTSEQGLALWDAALRTGEPLVVPARLDRTALRARAEEGRLPALLSGLVRAGRRAAANTTPALGNALRDRLVDLDAGHRYDTVLEVVREQAAVVLGHSGADAIEPDRAFKELGFDSLDAVGFRDRLGGATGVKLPASAVFDYPSPDSLARFLLSELGFGDASDSGRPATAITVGATGDPLVIVGTACRYPGRANSARALWDMVDQGLDVVGELPADRGWDPADLYDPEPGKPGKSYARSGGFLYDAADFDAEFFGISPREALGMDPQQRLLLEVSWEALEDAGIDPHDLKGSDTGVFTGLASPQGYGGEGFGIPSIAASVASGRVSYVLGLEGPAMTVDTACSSSLVALHLAGQAVRSGECELALVGGVTVMSTPEVFVEFSRQQGLSPDGRCRSFDGGANGTGWAEGVGVLVVERLSRARELGHRVLAVVAGSAVNQDGASNGLTAPNGPSQQRVIRQALANAGLGIGDVDVVEAHGTGTKLGDPIEAQALLATYGQRDGGEPLWLGSIKSNMGHAQAAAGVAGVIKMVQAMRFGRMPATLHVAEPTPTVDWAAGRVELLTQARDWPRSGRPRRAAVSSFGISGTNAHVILEEAPIEDLEAEPTAATPPHLLPWTLAAKSAEALSAQAASLVEYVAAEDFSDRDIAAALLRRSVFDYRAVVFGTDSAQLTAGLESLAAGLPVSGVVSGCTVPGRTGVLFSGQGSQRLGMGRELAEAFPAFAVVLDEVVAELDRWLDRPLREVMWGSDEALLESTEYAQPALFAFEVAMFGLLRSWGVIVDAVAGHSVGEIAAAQVAGVLSLPDAARLVVLRGRLMQALPSGGAMASIQASEAEVLGELTAGVDIAAVNAEGAVVISGIAAAVESVAAVFAGRGRKTTRLRVSHAFHSLLMEPMLAQFAAEIADLRVSPPRIPVVSNLTGQLAGDGYAHPDYWVEHVRRPVRFAEGVAALSASGVARFLEVGPAAALAPMVAQSVDPVRARVMSTARREVGEVAAALSGVAELYVAGGAMRWSTLVPGPQAHRMSLPPYAFHRQRFWLDQRPRADISTLGLHAVEHTLLGAEIESPDSGRIVVTGRLSVSSTPWLADHAVFGRILLPGAGFVDLLATVADRVGCAVVRELTLTTPLILTESATALRIVVGEPMPDGSRTATVFGRPDTEASRGASESAGWTIHADAVLAAADGRPDPEPEPWVWPPAGATAVDLTGVYEQLALRGYDYGPTFRGLQTLWRAGEDVYAEVALPGGDGSGFGIHPALLDAALHAVLLTAADTEQTVLPFAWSGIRLSATGATRVRVRLRTTGTDSVSVDIVDPTGQSVLSADSLISRPVSAEQLAAVLTAAPTDGLYDTRWVPALDVPGTDQAATPEPRVLRGVGDVSDSDPTGEVHARVAAVLAAVQAWLSEPQPTEARLVVLTRGAVDTGQGAVTDLAGAAVWGLVASAQAENPGRIILLDSDIELDDAEIGRAVRRVPDTETQLALRSGDLFVPRLTAVEAPNAEARVAHPALDAGVVIVTGGTGGLGSVLAQHLVDAHGARDLVLTSRRGSATPGVEAVVGRLRAAGARVRVVACDMADRNAVRELVSEVHAAGPLIGVVHAAGVLDDGVLEALTADRLRSVLTPKVDGGWNLHEATAAMNLPLFVVFSSIAGVLGTPGQANYAAGNRFLDGLISYRRAHGLSGTSLAWGLWAENTGMTGRLGDGDRSRAGRDGLADLTTDQGLALWDAALASDRALLVPARLDRAALGALAQQRRLPAQLSNLVRAERRVAGVSSGPADLGLRDRLAGLDADRAHDLLLSIVREHAAAVLGHGGATGIAPDRAFKELGFDSLAAVDFRNRLGVATGLRLPASLIFDYPDSVALVGYLAGELDRGTAARQPDPGHAVGNLLTDLETALADGAWTGADDQTKQHLLKRLRVLTERWAALPQPESDPNSDIESASGDELFALIDREF